MSFKNLFSTKKKATATPNDKYTNAESIFTALEDGSVNLLRASWLVDLNKKGGVLGRRQDLPAAAFISVAELRKMYSKSKAVYGKGHRFEAKPLPIVAVSHWWRTKAHPDPKADTLKVVALQLNYLLTERFSSGSTCKEMGLRDFGVFFDYGSLFQEPRTEEEQAAFKRSLGHINLWYAHALTTCIMVTAPPGPDLTDIVPYHDRGWCSFEYQLALLLLTSEYISLWPQLLENDKPGDSLYHKRPALADEHAFFEGGTCGSKIFTNGADREIVARKWKETAIEVMSGAVNLFFQNAGWGDEEMKYLAVALRSCKNLAVLSLRGNPFTSLPQEVGQVATLERLTLANCTQLKTLPAELAQLPKLEMIDLSGCDSLSAVPVELRERAKGGAGKAKLELKLPPHIR